MNKKKIYDKIKEDYKKYINGQEYLKQYLNLSHLELKDIF